MKKSKFFAALLGVPFIFFDVNGCYPLGFKQSAELSREGLTIADIRYQVDLRCNMLRVIGRWNNLARNEQMYLQDFSQNRNRQASQQDMLNFLSRRVDSILDEWNTSMTTLRKEEIGITADNILKQACLRIKQFNVLGLQLNDDQRVFLNSLGVLSQDDLRRKYRLFKSFLCDYMDPLIEWMRKRKLAKDETFEVQLQDYITARIVGSVTLHSPADLLRSIDDNQAKRDFFGIFDGEEQHFVDQYLTLIPPQRRFGNDSELHSFLDGLNVIHQIAQDPRMLSSQFRLLLIKFCTKWVNELSLYCRVNVIAEADEQKIRDILRDLDATKIGCSNTSLLLGDHISGYSMQGGIGQYGKSILKWIHDYRQLHETMNGQIMERAHSYFELEGDEVNNFRQNLASYNRSVFDFLTFKPYLFQSLLNPANGLPRREEEIVSDLMPSLVTPLREAQKLKSCFVKSSFGEVFSPDIFLAFAKRQIRALPQDANNAEVFIAAYLSDELVETPFLQIREILREITNAGDATLFSDIVENGVRTPKLLFPQLTLNEVAIGHIRPYSVSDADWQIFENAYSDYCDVARDYLMTDAQLRSEYCDHDAVTAMFNAFKQHFDNCNTARDSTYRALREFIDSEDGTQLIQNFTNVFSVGALRAAGVPEDEIQDSLLAYVFQHKDNFLRNLDEISLTKRELERIKRQLGLPDNAESFIPKRKILPRIRQAIEKYNAFADAFRSHVTAYAVEDVMGGGDERFLEGAGIALPVSESESFDVSSDGKFIGDYNLFTEWHNKFYAREANSVGILAHQIDDGHGGDDLIGVSGLTSYQEGDASYDVYTRLSNEFINRLNGVNKRASDALVEQVYRISFINIMLRKDGDRILYTKLIDRIKNMLRNNSYHSERNISLIPQYTVTQETASGLYDIHGIGALLPQQDRDLSIDQLRELLAYYFAKGLYFCLTNDFQMANHYNRNGEVGRGGDFSYSFPSQYTGGCVNRLKERDGLFDILIERAKRERNYEDFSRKFPDLAIALLSNGDTADHMYSERYVTALRLLKDNLWSDNNGVFFNIQNDVVGSGGIFCEQEFVRLIVSRLRRLDVHDANGKVPDFNPGWIGTMMSRFSHCLNGRTEGTINLFSCMLPSYPFENGNALDFMSIMKALSFLAAKDIINTTFNFSLHADGSDNREEATFAGAVSNYLGENSLFGMVPNPHFYLWAKGSSLSANCVAVILSTLNTHLNRNAVPGEGVSEADKARIAQTSLRNRICDILRHRRVADPVYTEAERPFVDFLRARSRQITGEIQRAIANINNETDRRKVQEACEIFTILQRDLIDSHDNLPEYKEQVTRIAKMVVNSSNIIDWFIRNDTLFKVAFDAYKQSNYCPPQNRNANFDTMTKVQKKQALLDMLVAFGLFTEPAGAH